MEASRRPEHRSDAELIEIADELRAMTQTRGWRLFLEMVERKREAALEGLAVCDPTNVGQVARLQAQAHESRAIPTLVDEAIHRGEQARKRAQGRARGGDDA